MVRPPAPRRSRSVRSEVARGSIAYSAVTHPSPVPFLNGGTPCSTLAVQWTSVPPIRMRHDPSAYGMAPRSRVRGRNWSGTRPSGRATKTLHDGSTRESADHRDADDATAPRLDQVATHDRLAGVVRTLDQDVRLKRGDEAERRVLVEQDHAVDRREGGKQPGPSGFIHDGAIRSLAEPADRGVGVDADHERVALGTGRLQQAHVTGMQQIEHAVGEHHRPALGSAPGTGLLHGANL